MAIPRRFKGKPVILVLVLSITLFLMFKSYLGLNDNRRSGVSKLRSFFTFSVTKQKGGSSINYSIETVDTFIELYRSKQVALGSQFILIDSEPYNEFRKRLRSDKKSNTLLHLQLNDNGLKTNLSGTKMGSCEKFYNGINQYELYDPNEEDTVANLLNELATRPIVKAESPLEYNQTTIILTNDLGCVGVFKPKKFSREYQTPEDLLYFSEFEHHTSEIAAFHLDRIFGFNRSPPSVGRMINVTSDIKRQNNIYPYMSPVGNKCLVVFCKQYCDSACAICGEPEMLEGSLTISLPGRQTPIVKDETIHPWRRTYTIEKAAWELDDGYCNNHVKIDLKYKKGRILLDLVDMAVFDFLTGNMNRQYFDKFDEFAEDAYLLHSDNSKGFSKSHYDCMSCLAPLRQCCLIRLSTLAKLIKLYQGPDSLSHLMRTSLNSDPIAPILLEPHLDALDRRLGKVIKAVSDCVNSKSWDDVVVNDGVH